MGMSCFFGLHRWNGNVCVECGKIKKGVAKIVKIGSFYWAMENLNVSRFRNGQRLMYAKTNEDWKYADAKGIPAWCYYENKSKYQKKVGKLYNWYAVCDRRGLAPVGFHIPTLAEFQNLSNAVRQDSNFIRLIRKDVPKDQYSNITGFCAQLAGYRRINGQFIHIGHCTSYWSCSAITSTTAFCMCLSGNTNNIHLMNYGMGYGFSVRCVRD